MASRLSSFLGELKRRKVYQVALVYAVVGFGVAQGAEYLFQILEFPLVAAQFVAALVVLGFPVALVLAWAYEVKPEQPSAAGPSGAVGLGAAERDDGPSIVVLPFDNMSPDPADAYFSDGLTEEIITDLSALHSLRVISRSSAVALKGTQKDVRTIGSELGVRYVLEGSVRKAGDDLRITAQLIDATSDRHLWSERYDGKLEDVFGMQEKVSRSIVESLKLRLNPQEDRALSARPIQDPRAYDTYLLAMHESRTLTPEGITRALHLTNQAIEVVGDNAQLFAVLAYCHYLAYDFGIRHQERTLLEAERWASKALEPDPGVGLAH